MDALAAQTLFMWRAIGIHYYFRPTGQIISIMNSSKEMFETSPGSCSNTPGRMITLHIRRTDKASASLARERK